MSPNQGTAQPGPGLAALMRRPCPTPLANSYPIRGKCRLKSRRVGLQVMDAVSTSTPAVAPGCSVANVPTSTRV
jgi:hypothetical protein